MNTNFSRPSLGISQSSIFQASNDLASCSALRNEFAKNPNGILNKYDLPSISKSFYIDQQKTSEICTVPLFFCGFAVVAGVAVVVGVALGVVAGVYAAAVDTAAAVDSVVLWDYTEVYGVAMKSPLSYENYMGIC